MLVEGYSSGHKYAQEKKNLTRMGDDNSAKTAMSPNAASSAPTPFPWTGAMLLLTVSVGFIAMGMQQLSEMHEIKVAKDVPPAASTASADDIPIGDALNANALYRIRSHDAHPIASPFTYNVSDSPACSPEADAFDRCIPVHRRCGRMVVDHFIPDRAAEALIEFQKRVIHGFGQGGGSGPVSLVELNLGIVSRKDRFISMIRTIEQMDASKRSLRESLDVIAGINPLSLDTFHNVVRKIHAFVSEYAFCPTFPCDSAEARDAARRHGRVSLRVAAPSFISDIRGGVAAKTVNDEYWHTHTDREQYGSFAITTLLYLNTQRDDAELDSFEGGQFEFAGDHPATVEPRRGRLSIFTSGPENPHFVAPVRDGHRHTLTLAFTCSSGDGTFLVDEAAAQLYVASRTAQEDPSHSTVMPPIFLERIRKYLAESD
jgi:hypothetical protein